MFRSLTRGGGRPAIAAASVIALALIVRLAAAMQAGSLWRDEANDVFVVRNAETVDDLLTSLTAEGSPPLRFLFEYGIHHLVPDKVWPARLVVISLGTAAVAGTIVLGLPVFGATGAILGGLLMATSPFFIRESVELRGYALYQLTAILYGLAMVGLLRRRTLARALAAGVAGGALALTHYFGLFLVFSALAFAAWRTRRQRRETGLVLLAGLVSLALFAPALPLFVTQASGDLRHWALPSRRGLDLVLVLALPLGQWSGPFVALALAIGYAALFRHRRSERDVTKDAWLLLLCGAIGTNVLGWCAQFLPVTRVRIEAQYLVGPMTWIMPLVGFGIAQAAAVFEPRADNRAPDEAASSTLIHARRAGVATSIMLAVAISQAASVHAWLRPRSPMPELVALIRDRGQPTDLIVLTSIPHSPTFSFYYDGPIEQWSAPLHSRVTNVPWKGLLDVLADPHLRQRFLDRLAAELERGRRVWLVTPGSMPLDRKWADLGSIPVVRTAYELALWELHRDTLRTLYAHARQAPIPALPEVEYWEPATLTLFERVDHR
jgi:hypothetical protein